MASEEMSVVEVQAGQSAILFGLKSVQFNNEKVLLLNYYGSRSRWEVELSSGITMKVKPENILVTKAIQRERKVKLFGLKSQKFNGEIGIADRFDAKRKRWDIDIGDRIIGVKIENLKPRQDVDKATEVVYASSGAAHNGVYGSYTSLIRCPAIQVSIKPFNGPPGTHELPTKFYQILPGTPLRQVFRRYQPNRRLDGSLRFYHVSSAQALWDSRGYTHEFSANERVQVNGKYASTHVDSNGHVNIISRLDMLSTNVVCHIGVTLPKDNVESAAAYLRSQKHVQMLMQCEKMAGAMIQVRSRTGDIIAQFGLRGCTWCGLVQSDNPQASDKTNMACASCKLVRYCCEDHQRKDWNMFHKYECKALRARRKNKKIRKGRQAFSGPFLNKQVLITDPDHLTSDAFFSQFRAESFNYPNTIFFAGLKSEQK